jgi:hypothetical protein
MSRLLPCPACQRHVDANETSCPFCQAVLSPAPPCAGCSGPPVARLARAALVAAGAALLGAACSSSQSVLAPYGVPPHYDAGTDSPQDAGAATDGPANTNDSAK